MVAFVWVQLPAAAPQSNGFHVCVFSFTVHPLCLYLSARLLDSSVYTDMNQLGRSVVILLLSF
jgi:hypothetical protein